MDPFSEPLASCKSICSSNLPPIKTCTRKDSRLSDRERDAPEFVRALSSDVSPDAPSLSSSDSHSHYRSSIGSFSLRCPLLDPDRHASETAVLAMHPLPALAHERSPVYTYYNPSGVGARLGPGPALSPISSTSTSGGNLFVPLRRRFLPNTDRVLGGGGKARVETQLLGELLLALEEYVAAFGRQVKAIPARQFGSAAVVVVAATAGLGLIEASLTVKEREWQGQTQVEREALGELCAELEHVTREVVDAVPAFGEKLMQGHYGPLAVQGTWASDCEQAHPASALARFADYEPGGSKDTSEGGAGWWAERLLRDLVEGIVAETVVKSASTNMLLSGQLGTRRGIGQGSNNDGCRAGLSRAICEAQQAKNRGKVRSWTRSLVKEESEGSSEEDSSDEDRRPVGGPCLSDAEAEREGHSRHKAVSDDNDSGAVGNAKNQSVDTTDSHQKELLDMGRKRWLAFKAKTG